MVDRVGAVTAVAVFILCCLNQATSNKSDRHYKAGDDVPLYVNNVGPYANPRETYGYYSLPFCRPDGVEQKELTFGELLNGDQLATAPYRILFLQDKHHEVACKTNLSVGEVLQLRSAIEQDYFYEMYCDDLPMWGFLGLERQTVDGRQKFFLFKHIQFELFYNKDQITDASISLDVHDAVNLTDNKDTYMELLYSVRWVERNNSFVKRMDRYKESNHFHTATHWFPILNSCLTLLLLVTSLAVYYVRVVRKDFFNFSPEDMAVNQEQKGWKYLCFDVFRYPPNRCLFTAFLGYGAQLLTLAVLILLLGLLGLFYPYNRGNLLIALIFAYASTSAVAGYISVSFYHQLEGTNWVKNLLLLGSISYGPLLLSFCFTNAIAKSYQANAALPFSVVSKLILIFALVTLPLIVLGGFLARKLNRPEFEVACEPSKCPREIPPMRWYKRTIPQMFVGGILPFGVVYIELYYLFVSVWGHRVYTLYSVLMVIFGILLVTTCLVTVTLTHFQLAAEDHKWWWRSFLCGGSAGLYMFGYTIFYYYYRTRFSGFLQTSLYLGYMACICFGIFVMLGSLGFYASLLYVRHIYSSIKSD